VARDDIDIYLEDSPFVFVLHLGSSKLGSPASITRGVIDDTYSPQFYADVISPHLTTHASHFTRSMAIMYTTAEAATFFLCKDVASKSPDMG